MSAGRLQLYAKRASMRDRTSRVLLRLSEDRELRLREFGTRQAAWVKLLRPDALEAEDVLRTLGPEAWPEPPEDLGAAARLPAPAALAAARPAGDRRASAAPGSTTSCTPRGCRPFKRGDDLSEEEVGVLREAIASELGRVIDHYEETVQLPLPEKFPKPTRVHAHQGEPCPRCETVLEAVFYEDYVMTYCPECQTEGRVLKDRRLSRLLK